MVFGSHCSWPFFGAPAATIGKIAKKTENFGLFSVAARTNLVSMTRISPRLKSAAKPGSGHWLLQDAKARFSEVVRLAGTEGPQLVTVRGKEAAVILAPEEYERLLPKARGHQPLVRFLQGLGLEDIEIEREMDTGREPDL